MTIRQSLIRSAKAAKPTLDDSCGLVEAFVRSKFNADGGFSGRAARSDLYYTMFAVELLLILSQKHTEDSVGRYLGTFDPGRLDLIHIGCLCRAYADINAKCSDIEAVLHQVESYSTPDGGYDILKNSPEGSVYGCFVAAALYEDMELNVPNQDGILNCLNSLLQQQGPVIASAAPLTAALVTLKKMLSQKIEDCYVDWLLAKMHPNGGFVAGDGLPLPDLLSTATVLHALSFTDVELINDDKEKCLDFIDSLWSGDGAFCGSIADQTPDTEYTFYGLLAIGHLT